MFTLDAVLALFLVLIMITAITTAESQVQSVYKTKMRMGELGDANAMLKLLRTVPLSQLVPASVIQDWESGTDPVLNLTLVTPDMSPLEIAATYWAVSPIYPGQDYRKKASVILGYILNSTLRGYNYELLINNWTNAFMSKGAYNYSLAKDVSSATLVLSGYAYNQTPRGYVARAFLSKLKAKVTSYTYFGSSAFAYGPNENDYTVVRYYIPNEGELPVDANITEVEWFPQPRWFSCGGSYSYMELYIDGEPVKCGQFKEGQFVAYKTWEVLKDDSLTNSCNILDILKRHSDLRRHVFEVRVYNPCAGGVHPNSFITIKYTTSQANTFNYPHQFHFDEIITRHPFQVENAVFIPGQFRNMSVQVKIINASEVGKAPKLYITYRDKRVEIGYGTYIGDDTFKWTNEQILSKLEGEGITSDELSDTYLWFAVTFGMDYKSPLYPPTVTFNSEVKLDFQDSYVDIDYVPSTYISMYSIDITRSITAEDVVNEEYEKSKYGTEFYTMLEWRFNISESATPLFARLHIVRLHTIGCDEDSYDQKLYIKNDKISWTTVYCHGGNCNPNNPFIDPGFTRWGFVNGMPDYRGNPINDALYPGDNYIEAKTGSCYVMSKEFTTGDYTYLLNAYAPYGNVKPYLMQGYPNIKAYNLTYAYDVGGSVEYGSIIVGDTKAIASGEYANITACQLDPDKYAVDDAVLRLFKNLGGDGCTKPVLVDLGDTMISYVSLPGVPRSISPITVTLRIWRVGG
ncbi:hypothetical protein [Thermococcus nautili]|uniref:hypothetical protein n=1 Tax=Thermococcus nautili TaxID=195522 RepID=UPI0012EB365A|nr:hypothetical protein [Thermococcus nautili]